MGMVKIISSGFQFSVDELLTLNYSIQYSTNNDPKIILIIVILRLNLHEMYNYY